ncbi:STAS domain-containing protein [Planktotalea sp.]|uniref:STAS domain-containing protein n=1 Tax=Planktotalea sp. TaxID=2029877 RepID=UPI0025D96EB7|nr:STAS domain-containing protein [Planktotalea sp.]
MKMTSEITSDLQIITVLEKRIDGVAAIQFKNDVRELTAEGDTAAILDLSNVDFVDSSGLGAIVAAMKLLGTDRPLHLAGLTPIVSKVFALTRMERVFKIFKTPLEALKTNEAKSA